jgi:hypothetical protein
MATLTPEYYPEGWNRERMLNSSVKDDWDNLTEESLSRFCEGLRADLGDEGYD